MLPLLNSTEGDLESMASRPRSARRPNRIRSSAGSVPWWARRTSAAVLFTATAAVVGVACGTTTTDTAPSSPTGSDRGGELYRTSCASCHGEDLRGTDKGPSHLSIVYEPNHHGDDAFRSAIVNGAQQHHWNFGDMAPVPGLGDEEIDDIIAFVRAEQERLGFEQ